MKTKKIIVESSKSVREVCRKLLERFKQDTLKVGKYIISDRFRFTKDKEKEEDFDKFSVILIDFDDLGELMESRDIIAEMEETSLLPLSEERFFILGKKRPEILARENLPDLPVVNFEPIWEREGELFLPCSWGDYVDFPDIWYFSEPWPKGKCLFAASGN